MSFEVSRSRRLNSKGFAAAAPGAAFSAAALPPAALVPPWPLAGAAACGGDRRLHRCRLAARRVDPEPCQDAQEEDDGDGEGEEQPAVLAHESLASERQVVPIEGGGNGGGKGTYVSLALTFELLIVSAACRIEPLPRKASDCGGYKTDLPRRSAPIGRDAAVSFHEDVERRSRCDYRHPATSESIPPARSAPAETCPTSENPPLRCDAESIRPPQGRSAGQGAPPADRARARRHDPGRR